MLLCVCCVMYLNRSSYRPVENFFSSMYLDVEFKKPMFSIKNEENFTRQVYNYFFLLNFE